jgi:hypothetical protein
VIWRDLNLNGGALLGIRVVGLDELFELRLPKKAYSGSLNGGITTGFGASTG